VWQSIEKIDGMGMNIIQTHDAPAFEKYIKDTQNTICGRHPIGIYLNILKLSKLNLKTKFVKYAQSEQVKSKTQTSVSYASAVTFIPE
jgi:AmmeMemoRadiSam system protein B